MYLILRNALNLSRMQQMVSLLRLGTGTRASPRVGGRASLSWAGV